MRIAIIPARGGSQRIPRKNVRPFFGKPIIAYSIEAAKKTGLFQAVMVSTEDAEIADVAMDCGAFVLRRPASLARDEVGTQEVMRHAVRDTDAEFACCIYPCAPLLTDGDLTAGWMLLEHVRPRRRYVYVTGWYYWGRAQSFIDRPEIESALCMDQNVMHRWVDINTEEDWAKAEGLYAELHRKAA